MTHIWAPTTDQVRRGYRSPFDSPYAEDEFDRWLARHDAEIRAQAIAPLLVVHAEYFNTEVDAYTAAEDFASEDAWRFDRDFREAVNLIDTNEETK